MKNFSRPPFFPMMIDINGREILIIGGGHIASRRAETLLRCGAIITAVSPEFCESFPEVFEYREKFFEPKDIDEKFDLVFAATNSREINKLVHDTAKAKKIFVNVCDCQDECDFFFPSLINVENVAVSVCTAGFDSKLTRKLSHKLRRVWPLWVEKIRNAKSSD